MIASSSRKRLRLLGISFVHRAISSIRGPLLREARARTLGSESASRRSLRSSRSRKHQLARGELVAPDDQRVTRAIAVGDLQVREQLAILIVHERRRRRAAGAARRRSAPRRFAPADRARSPAGRAAAALRALAASREHHEKALHAQREADGGNVGSAERLHEGRRSGRRRRRCSARRGRSTLFRRPFGRSNRVRARFSD